MGKQQCRSCHVEIYDSYVQTGMGKSLNANHNPSSMSEHLSYTRSTTACYILTGATGGTSSYSFGGDVAENSVCIIR